MRLHYSTRDGKDFRKWLGFYGRLHFEFARFRGMYSLILCIAHRYFRLNFDYEVS